MKLNAKELRKGLPATDYRLQRKSEDGRRNAIYIILDNVLDTYNIGSIFRLADAVGAKKVYLCGETETPPNSRIKKASINTTEWVEWEYCETTVEAIKKLRQQFTNRLPTTDYRKAEDGRQKTEDIQIVAIEQSSRSIPYDKFEYKLPIALIVGHESHGVSKEVLEMADGLPAGEAGIVEIPMFGVNTSLNVMISLGIVLYEVIEKTIPK